MKNKILTTQLQMVFIALLLSTTAFSQVVTNYTPESLHEKKESFDHKYGLDPNLMNGIKYNYPYANINGDPFLLERKTKGNIQINGKLFIGEEIRFDILNNQLILVFIDHSKKSQSIVLRNEWVDQFEWGDKLFKKVVLEGNNERFVQVIFEGNTSCYYDWTKELKLASGTGSHYYYFADAKKTGILLHDGQEMHFRGKRSFLKHFQKNEKQEIKRYLKSEKIRFNKANYRDMRDIITYSNQI